MGLVRDVCIALNNLGMVYTDTERWDEAELSYREAVELVRDLRDIALRVQIEVNVVEMWVARRDFDRARAAADAAMELASQMGDAHIPGDAYRLLGVIERESGDLARAESMLERAAELAAARQDMLLMAETSREQAEVHRRQGRNRETLQALNRAHQLFTQLRARRDLADVDRQTTHLEGEFIDVVRRWGESIEAKDRYTQGHCERVADLACALAARSGFDERTLFWFRIGALLHDVGKLIIPAEVLNKPAKLDGRGVGARASAPRGRRGAARGHRLPVGGSPAHRIACQLCHLPTIEGRACRCAPRQRHIHDGCETND